jgi:DNA-binding PadR family transcriptional regulator
MSEGDGAGRKLPATSYAILGLLTFGQELSGYDLGKVVEQSIGFFWTPAKSQVYGELRRLVAVGYATGREVEQSGRPDKRLYAITPDGCGPCGSGWSARPSSSSRSRARSC